jgi:LemA protein
MSWLPVTLFTFLGFLVVWAFSRYNGLVRSKKRVDEAWSGIDVQLRRRASLIPNLVETVKGYATHERELLEEVTRARGALQTAGNAGQASTANDLLSQAMGRLFAVVESYPQLRASDNFMGLRSDLADVEEKIAFARQFYNRNVLDYNTRLETYPDTLFARQFTFTAAEFFAADEAARSEVTVSFSRDAQPRSTTLGTGPSNA